MACNTLVTAGYHNNAESRINFAGGVVPLFEQISPYSQEYLGQVLNLSPNFETPSDWNVPIAGITVTTGKATIESYNGSRALVPVTPVPITAGKKYLLRFDVATLTGALSIRLRDETGTIQIMNPDISNPTQGTTYASFIAQVTATFPKFAYAVPSA